MMLNNLFMFCELRWAHPSFFPPFFFSFPLVFTHWVFIEFILHTSTEPESVGSEKYTTPSGMSPLMKAEVHCLWITCMYSHWDLN